MIEEKDSQSWWSERLKAADAKSERLKKVISRNYQEYSDSLIAITKRAEAAEAERDAALALWRKTSETAAQSQECAIAYQDGLHDGEAGRAVEISKLMAQNAKLKAALRSMMAIDLGFSERLRLARKARAVLAECEGDGE